MAPHLDVVVRALADRHRGVREVRQREQGGFALMLDRVELDAELLDLLCAAAVRFLNRRRVVPLPLGARDLVARRVLLPLQSLELGNDAAPRRLERGDVLEHLVGIEPAVAQAVADLLDVIANVGRIEHIVVISLNLRRRTRAHAATDRVTIPDVSAAVRKAVFPAAGLGTRFLPATKAQPKEMLPLVDKPIIQYGVEEAVASGVDNIILVTGRGKNAIEDHFDVSVELETFLEARGKREQLDEVRKISNLINFAYVRQGEPLGLGHAVLVTRELVGNEPFAVILGDDVIDADPPALRAADRRLREGRRPGARGRARAAGGDLELRRDRARPGAQLGEGVYRVLDLVEKPPVAEAPSDLAIIGRYILTPDIFPALAATKSDRTGEIQLTNGLRELLKTRPIYACEVKGVRHDTGNKLGFLKAVVYFALRRPGSRRQVHRVSQLAGDSRENQRLRPATTSAWYPTSRAAFLSLACRSWLGACSAFSVFSVFSVLLFWFRIPSSWSRRSRLRLARGGVALRSRRRSSPNPCGRSR